MIAHNDGQPTRRGKSSVIDLIITPATLICTVTSCDTPTHEVVRSDHIAILTELAIDTTNDFDGTRRFRNFKKANRHAWKEMTDTKLSVWFEDPPKDLETVFNSFDHIISTCFKELFPVKTVRTNTRPKAPYWWNDVWNKKKSLNQFRGVSSGTLPKIKQPSNRQKIGLQQ